jgi:hypothetical protein
MPLDIRFWKLATTDPTTSVVEKQRGGKMRITSGVGRRDQGGHNAIDKLRFH